MKNWAHTKGHEMIISTESDSYDKKRAAELKAGENSRAGHIGCRCSHKSRCRASKGAIDTDNRADTMASLHIKEVLHWSLLGARETNHKQYI